MNGKMNPRPIPSPMPGPEPGMPVVELCPFCRTPVHFVPDMTRRIDEPDRSHMSCPRCPRQFPVDFDGFILAPIERPVWVVQRRRFGSRLHPAIEADPLIDRYEEAFGDPYWDEWRDDE